MNDQLTKDIQAFLNLSPDERNIKKGADMLLSLNRNRILYHNILRRPAALASKLEYELKKHLKIRLDGLTVREVALMDMEVKQEAKAIIKEGAAAFQSDETKQSNKSKEAAPAHRGRRTDHEALPDEIKALYDRNCELFKKIKAEYAAVRALDSAMPCDRYEHLKVLAALDKEYRANWAAYDDYSGGDLIETPNKSNKSK